MKGNYEEHVRRMDVSTKGKFEANKDQFYSESNDSLGESEKVYGVVHPFASMDVQDRAMSQSIDRSSSLAERNLGSSTLDPMPTIREDLAISTHNMSSDEFKETNQKCSTPEMYNRADVCEVR